MKNIRSNKYLNYTLFALAGLLLGWLFFHNPRQNTDKHDHASETAEATVWTCSMHPNIRMDKPGKCPICGMDLIPLNSSSAHVDADAIHLTKEAAELANVQTSVVSQQPAVKEVRMYGKVQADERLLQSQTAHIPGRIDKLLVNFAGETVRKGQTLAIIYSPELVTAQQELLEASKWKQQQPEVYEASKEKLRQWQLTESQITSIETSENTQNNFEVVANTSGIVTARRVNTGDYVAKGAVLFDIADLSRVWLMFDAYESDLPFLAQGNQLNFTVQALPGINFTGNIKFIDPVIDPVTRVAKVRVEVANGNGKLKPEMFATGSVSANLAEYANNLIIPKTSVLWTGKRSVVYVKVQGSDEPIFKLREVDLGPLLGNSYVITGGLSVGEEIVTQGAFSVDAAAQLEGKPSMMNHDGGVSSGHNHGTSAPSTTDENSDPSTHNTKPTTAHAMFTVAGNCDQCKERIEKAASSVNGVKSAVWDSETHKIHLEFDAMATNSDAVQKAIAKVGHDTDKFKADDKTYNGLPECCLYR